MHMPRLAPALLFASAAALSQTARADDTTGYTPPVVAAAAEYAADNADTGATTPADEAHAAAATEQAPGFFRRWFGSRSTPIATPEVATRDLTDAVPALGKAAAAEAGKLVANALGLIGVNYRRGGNTPDTGFDCSGMVRYVFQNALGLDLPRRAVEISRFGAKIDRNDLKPGDLVFYNTLRSTFSHVGIYLGGNRFIHAPSRGSTVRIDDMTQSYWAARFSGARRVAN